MEIIAVTRKGTRKAENEDRIVIGKTLIAEGAVQTHFSSGVIAVADGVGGHKAGAVAAQFVAGKLAAAEHLDRDVLQRINADLLQLSASRGEYANMATTLSGIFVGVDKTVLFSVGNTRVYSLRGGKYWKQLTEDDTTLRYLLATGQLKAEEAERFGRKNEITACFGGESPDLLKIKFSPFDGISSPFMITSDGIHDYVSVDQMEDVVGEYGLTMEACEALIATARNGGSQDDVSIVLGGL